MAETDQNNSKAPGVPTELAQNFMGMMNISDREDMPKRKAGSKRRRIEATMMPDLEELRLHIIHLENQLNM